MKKRLFSTIPIVLATAAALAGSSAVADASTVAGSAQPDSHSGCNNNTCIDVYGSGLTVAGWDSYAHLSGSVCGYAYFYVNGKQVGRSSHCYRGNTPKVYAAGFPKNYPNGTQLCNEWVPGGNGYPCATVHN